MSDGDRILERMVCACLDQQAQDGCLPWMWIQDCPLSEAIDYLRTKQRLLTRCVPARFEFPDLSPGMYFLQQDIDEAMKKFPGASSPKQWTK